MVCSCIRQESVHREESMKNVKKKAIDKCSHKIERKNTKQLKIKRNETTFNSSSAAATTTKLLVFILVSVDLVHSFAHHPYSYLTLTNVCVCGLVLAVGSMVSNAILNICVV